MRMRLAPVFAFSFVVAALAACAAQPPPPSQPPPPLANPSPPQAQPAAKAERSAVIADLTIQVEQSQALAFEAFTAEIDRWWDHSFVEKPYRLTFDPRPGGAFVERFDAKGNGAEHARIIYANWGHEVRFVGPLGFSGQAVEFVHTLRFSAAAAGTTKVDLRVEVLGNLGTNDRQLVQGVWQHFLGAFSAYCAKRPKHALYVQVPVQDVGKIGLGFFSHEGRGKARNHVHADDFRLRTAATLRGLSWWGHLEGSSQGSSQGNSNDKLEDLKGFVVRIHAMDPDGSPGKVLLESDVDLAASQPTFTGRQVAQADRPGAREWQHRATFDQPLALEADVTYFVSIAAKRRSPQSEAWQWTDAEFRNGLSYSHPLEQVGWQAIQDTDSAFELDLEP